MGLYHGQHRAAISREEKKQSTSHLVDMSLGLAGITEKLVLRVERRGCFLEGGDRRTTKGIRGLAFLGEAELDTCCEQTS